MEMVTSVSDSELWMTSSWILDRVQSAPTSVTKAVLKQETIAIMVECASIFIVVSYRSVLRKEVRA